MSACATSSWPWIETPPAPAGRVPMPAVVLGPASVNHGFVCNQGAFRIVVTSLFYARDIVLAPPILARPRAGGPGRAG